MGPTLLSEQPILELLPGETLYNLAARFHFVCGSTTPAATGRLLFSHPLAGLHHEFTGHVDGFAKRLQLQDPRAAVLRHTILSAYLPFHSADHCENWIARLIAGSPSSLKAELCLLASRFGASHPLKACAHCVEHDSATYGASSWHVEHQLFGVTICRIHHSPLMHSPSHGIRPTQICMAGVTKRNSSTPAWGFLFLRRR
ncbi:MAG: TniQ family protein [Gammaproteobacteria bacterium]|nr:TniQ family protein [Gammaproteobacteria bacterium]MBU0786864.1 TniQ family protein [Gammaproteobacteria bacterium]MBU0813930.1 TniQ family protein [Gammaproteobacteria bacterium]MBU1788597.1 TniQ family protein [Gammaproteobacteria bacterium]